MVRADTIARWEAFKLASAQEAAEVTSYVLNVCEIESLDVARTTNEFAELENAVSPHYRELGLSESVSKTDLLRWATIVGFYELSRTVRGGS